MYLKRKLCFKYGLFLRQWDAHMSKEACTRRCTYMRACTRQGMQRSCNKILQEKCRESPTGKAANVAGGPVDFRAK